MSDTEAAEILALSKKIIYTYYGDNNPDYLFSFLAPDIIWLGAGKAMRAEGAENVRRFFETGRDQMLTCIISDEHYRTMQLGSDYWLCEAITDIEPKPGQGSFLHECQRCSFVYRRNPANHPGWEIVHLNNSIAYKLLKPQELFAIAEGARNYELLKKDPAKELRNEDNAALFSLLEKGIREPCAPETKELLTALCLFPHFTAQQAEAIWPQKDTAIRLHYEQERNSFLYFEAVQRNYRFHPVFRSYLQRYFEQHPAYWQRQLYSRAARWYLSTGEFQEAITFARQSQNFELLLTIVTQAESHIKELTPREKKLVTLILQGCSNREAAEKLHIAEITVKKSLSHIYEKFGLKNRQALTLFFADKL